MPRMMKKYTTIDEYILNYPEEVQVILKKIKKTISESAPGANEAIKYGIPTFQLNGNLVHFAAYESHIGFYPTSSGIKKFKKELKKYETAKGTVRFPIEKKIPFELIRKIVKYRVCEVLR